MATEDKPTARDWQNRAERAEAECKELRERLEACLDNNFKVHRTAEDALARLAIAIKGESNGQ